MFEEIEKAIAEIQQPRSRFALERFVIGAQDTDEMKYFQTVTELQDMMYRYELGQLNIKEIQLKIQKLRESGDAIKEIKAQKLELELKQLVVAMVGAQREISDLVEIFSTFKKRFTREEIEAAQPDYWKARLTGTARAMLMGGTSVSAAQIQAMQQAGVLEELILEVQESKKELGL